MAQNKYVSPSKLSIFLENLKSIFSPIVHNHKVSELTDYVVDTELSSTSTNPIANKTINDEFESVGDALGALELAIDGKINSSDVVDNLTTESANKPLSAKQGVVLQTQITEATTTDNALTVQLGTNGTVGGYKTGDVIAAGTDIQTILNKLLQKAVAATYTQPTISLANNGGTASGNVEAGSTVTPKLRASFTKNDAGNLTDIVIKKGSISVATGTATPLDYSGSGIVVGDETVTFTASATYGDAPVKNNNLGEESKENWFAGGTITSGNYNITGKRKTFYGAGTGTIGEATSAIVRGMSNSKLAVAAGNTFTLTVATGSQHILFALPAPRTLKQVSYDDLGDKGMLASFTQSTVQVADARGGNNGLVSYNCYFYNLQTPSTASMTFTFTVA